jgi:HD-GYP domain-containing protein (c-di-GMP phosphodiesterase class II)
LSQCLDAGAHQYFLKPINFDEFHLALESTLRTHRRHREMRSQKQHLELCLHRQRRRLGKTFLSTVDSFVRLLEARDPFLSGHSLRVCSYVMHMAARLDLDAKSARRLHVAAKLHDIGKVGVPETILNKPGKLSPEEYTLVRKHPVIAQRILSPIVRSRAVLTAIRGHHERFDGKGYPDNLRGGNIPLLARIITIADAYDALTSTRAYRAALGHAAAVEILQDGAGTQFDPELVGPFLEVVSRSHR